MLTRKSIDTVLLSVGAEKLSQREWDWMKMLKPMDPPPAMVAASILERRGDTGMYQRLLKVDPLKCVLCGSQMRFTGLKRGYRLAELVLMHEPLARMRWCG
ncbi:transposase [Escherichia coli]|nr:transposase [Escherichia coli]